MNINKISSELADEVADLIMRNLGVFEEVGSVLASAFRRTAAILSTYAQDGSGYFVMTDPLEGHRLIGGAGVGPLAGLPASEGIGEIRELVIDERFRGKGYGKTLLFFCLQQARELGYKRIYLETTPQMLHARHLFEAFGFRPITHAPSKSQKPKPDTEVLACYYLLESLDEAAGHQHPTRSGRRSKDQSV